MLAALATNIYIVSEELHTDKSIIVLNSNIAVITRFFYSILFHMDFNAALFGRSTKC